MSMVVESYRRFLGHLNDTFPLFSGSRGSTPPPQPPPSKRQKQIMVNGNTNAVSPQENKGTFIYDIHSEGVLYAVREVGMVLQDDPSGCFKPPVDLGLGGVQAAGWPLL